MKCIRKIAASSVVFTLALFAGSFCLHPTASMAMAMDIGMHMGGQAMGDTSAFQTEDTLMMTWNLCVVNCATTVSQAVAAKKFSVDVSVDNFPGIADTGPEYAVSSALPNDAFDISPPVPDTLSSVSKKE